MTKNQYILLALFIGIGLFTFGTIFGYNLKQCKDCIGTTVVEIHDSTAPAKDTGVIAINTQPKLKETRKYSPEASHKNGTLAGDLDNSNDRTVKEYLTVCLDTNIFTVDTQQVDNFKAHATATVTNNQLIGLEIQYQNFKPEKWKILTKTVTVDKKQSLVKVYTGIYAGIAIQNKSVASYHGGIGFDAVLKDRHLIGLSGGINSNLQPEIGIRLMEKIILRK